MDEDREDRNPDAPPASTVMPESERRLSPWAALAPPVAWWWLMLAGAVAVAVGLGLLQVMLHFARPLGLLVLGVSLAASLSPIVAWLCQWLPRKLAIILLYVLLLLLIAGAGWRILPGFIRETESFLDNMPDLLDEVERWMNEYLPIEQSNIIDVLSSQLDTVSQGLLTLPLSMVGLAADVLADTIGVLFISLYGLLAAPSLQRFLLSLVPESRHARVRDVLAKVATAMGGYVRGVFLSGLLVGGLTYVGLLLLGVNYAAVLGVIAGLLEVIPIFGAVIATGVVTGTALFQSAHLALYALILMLVVEQIEGNIITPWAMHQQTKMNELTVLLAVFAGGTAGGIFGILVAIPLAAALTVGVQEVFAPLMRRWTGAVQ